MDTSPKSIEAQVALETEQVTRGVHRYMEAKARAEQRGRGVESGPVAKLLTDIMDAMIPALRDLRRSTEAKIKDALTRGTRLSGWEMPIAALTPEVIAYIAARTVMTRIYAQTGDSNGFRFERHNMALTIGSAVNNQFQWDNARRKEAERVAGDNADPAHNRINRLRATVKEVNPRHVKKWLSMLSDLETNGVERKHAAHVGLMIFDILSKTCVDFFDIQTNLVIIKGQRREVTNLSYTQDVIDRLAAAHVRQARALPWLLPMIAPPMPWARGENGYAGGYYRTPTPIIKFTFGSRHTDYEVSDALPDCVVQGLNRAQATGWRVNRDVLRVAGEAVVNGVDELLPVGLERELPENFPAAVWSRMTREQQNKHADARRDVHNYNNRMRAKRESMLRQLSIAEEFAEHPAIYFPHNMDFRGRIYPLPQDLNPQADDFGRALLTFADAKPLGETGVRWLCYHAANTFGNDKDSRDDQMKWVEDNLSLIHTVAADPLGAGLEHMKRAEEPWQFLAACIEIERAFQWAAAGNPIEEYQSSLPVQVDGSCNGLQHLSAMGLDPVGAEAVNLTPGPRRDIYAVVADKVASIVGDDNPWAGKVTRKVVKRGVMTVPYGLTPVGMKDQLIEDGHCDGLDGDKNENASYMRDCMREAIEETVVAASAIMEWLQFNAKQLSAAGRPIRWTTPTGMMVRQEYVKSKAQRVRTVFGTAVLYDHNADAKLRANKQVTSISPNVIHSFDAAHLYMTVNAAAERGVSAFSLIHDSFGAHASDMGVVSACLREQFVEIYKNDWFTSIQADLQAIAGDTVELAYPPERGDFDIEQVLRSDFFFA